MSIVRMDTETGEIIVSEETTQGWGWWTAFAKQDEWLAEAGRHIAFPDEKFIPAADSELPVLADALQRAGGSLAYLNANQGILLGRRYALKETLDAAMSAQIGRIPAATLKTLTNESAREGYVFADADIGEALRDTKRRIIEMSTCIEAQAGIIKAYEECWRTISRMMAVGLGEMEMTSAKHA